MTEGAGFSGRYANKPLPDVSGVRFGLKLLLASSGIIVLDESLPAARAIDRRNHRFDSFLASASSDFSRRSALSFFRFLSVLSALPRERPRRLATNYKINESRDRLRSRAGR